MRDFPDRLALLHPIWLGVIFVLSMIGALVAAVTGGTIFAVSVLLTYAGVIFPLLWARGVHNLAAQATGALNRKTASTPFWIAHACLFLGFGLWAATGPAAANGLLDALVAAGLLGYFACLWIAARALVVAENPASPPVGNATVGAFLLMVYWPFGGGFIRRRLQRLPSKNPATAT